MLRCIATNSLGALVKYHSLPFGDACLSSILNSVGKPKKLWRCLWRCSGVAEHYRDIKVRLIPLIPLTTYWLISSVVANERN